MKSAFLLLLVLCISPTMAYGHPGKTNQYGGHKCLKGCEDWGLFYGEYHLHDKDWKPIRVGRNKIPKAPGAALMVGPESNMTETVARETMEAERPKTEVVTTYRYVSNVYEENIFLSNPLVYILLILLLLLLILRMNRKREENQT